MNSACGWRRDITCRHACRRCCEEDEGKENVVFMLLAHPEKGWAFCLRVRNEIL